MDSLKTLHIFLEKNFKLSAEEGTHNFMNRIESAMFRMGFSVDYHLNSPQNRKASKSFQGYSLFHMQDPVHNRALNFRRAYFYPFWRIENTAERWNFRVSQTPYPDGNQDPNIAKSFANGMRKRHFCDVKASKGGFVYLPLQGRISEHRSFQTCSPLEMIEKALIYESERPIVAGLHPKETYSKKEMLQLEVLEKKHRRFSVSTLGSTALLPACDYVVTQNSSVALHGFFLKKPAVLFAQIDFHHIAGNVGEMGLEAAFEHARNTEANFDSYLLWFLRKTTINAGKDNAEDRIIAAMRKSGWEL